MIQHETRENEWKRFNLYLLSPSLSNSQGMFDGLSMIYLSGSGSSGGSTYPVMSHDHKVHIYRIFKSHQFLPGIKIFDFYTSCLLCAKVFSHLWIINLEII